uniref:Uncharacterized protein n=1 Tax=Glossina palpalis gambiensis TaxID=67801 RepID=A0A1B0BVI3_9MUSC
MSCLELASHKFGETNKENSNVNNFNSNNTGAPITVTAITKIITLVVVVLDNCMALMQADVPDNAAMVFRLIVAAAFKCLALFKPIGPTCSAGLKNSRAHCNPLPLRNGNCIRFFLWLTVIRYDSCLSLLIKSRFEEVGLW